MRTNIVYILLFSVLLLHCANQRRLMHIYKTTLDENEQMVVVISPNDTSIQGNLYRFERNEAKEWQLASSSHPITLGRSGLAWGTGIHASELAVGYQKKEGDGKSPAGIYRFGTAFGYAEAFPETKMPYLHVSEVTQCIEDANSKYYNQIIDNTKVSSDWSASDFMRRSDDLYKWGIFVEHNSPAEAEKGSCIFFHLWRAPDKPTAGCTGMEESNMVSLIQWLDPNKKPVLVQLTESQYPYWQTLYQLPTLPKA